MIQASLKFPESIFDKLNLTDSEIKDSIKWSKSIFDYNNELDTMNPNYGHLLKLVAAGNRYPFNIPFNIDMSTTGVIQDLYNLTLSNLENESI